MDQNMFRGLEKFFWAGVWAVVLVSLLIGFAVGRCS